MYCHWVVTWRRRVGGQIAPRRIRWTVPDEQFLPLRYHMRRSEEQGRAELREKQVGRPLRCCYSHKPHPVGQICKGQRKALKVDSSMGRNHSLDQ